MAVISRSALEASPLSDLHEIASEIGIDGFRRLRKEDLVDAVIERQGGDSGEDAKPARARRAPRTSQAAAGEKPAPRSRRAPRSADSAGDDAPATRSRRSSRTQDSGDDRPAPRSRRGGRSDAGDDAPRHGGDAESKVEGVLEVLANGSGFVRPNGPEASDDDVYVSAAQIRRC